jgi:hypothetical protein
MSLTINAKTFANDSYALNGATYVGTTKTVSVKDDLSLKRTAPKPTDVFSGVGRTTAKLTRTFTLTGAKTLASDAICEINVSVPIGYAGADVDALLNDMGSFLASVFFKTHVKGQQIVF